MRPERDRRMLNWNAWPDPEGDLKLEAVARLRAAIADLEKRMREAAGNLEFEEAARLRDEIKRLEKEELGV